MAISFSAQALEAFHQLIAPYPEKSAALIPVLHLAKREFNAMTPEVMSYVAGLLDVAPTRVMDVVSFYTLFPREQEGRYVIQVCATLSCSLMGAETILDYLQKKLQIGIGETTADRRFTLKKVECLGSCGTAPVMQINDDYYENLTPARIDEILSSLP
ncbi:MAG: NADH-quinone oxidoreductase subunit 2 [bacterium ADurb.Bin478]|nr:MAG: NADH-quinone oxidoreductase subunit 2 [bacterium ADurb.Bin478]